MYFRPHKSWQEWVSSCIIALSTNKKGVDYFYNTCAIIAIISGYLVGFSIIKNPRFYSYFILFLDCTLTKCKAYVLLSVTLLQLSILSYNIYPKLEKLPSEKLMDTHTHKDHSAFQPLQIHTEQSCMIKYLAFFLLCWDSRAYHTNKNNVTRIY